MAALAVFLWVANLLPIQRVEFHLATTLAISRHRLPSLLKLVGPSARHDLQLKELPFSIADLQIIRSKAGTENQFSELETVRISLILKNRSDLSLVESHLDRLTSHSGESIECDSFASKLRKEKWLLETQQHQLKEWDKDIAREKDAMQVAASDFAASDFAASVSTASKEAANRPAPLPMRLVSARRNGSTGGPIDSLRQDLVQKESVQASKVNEMAANLDRLRVKARGFLTLTGSPNLHPVAFGMTVGRLVVLLAVLLAFWILLTWLARTPNAEAIATGSHDRQTKPKRTRSKNLSDNSIEQTVHWLRSAGILYLGSVKWTDSQMVAIAASTSTKSEDLVRAPRSILEASRLPSSTAMPFIILKRVGELGLSSWMLVLLLRMCFDTAWRELVFVSPLAAVGRMIAGV